MPNTRLRLPSGRYSTFGISIQVATAAAAMIAAEATAARGPLASRNLLIAVIMPMKAAPNRVSTSPREVVVPGASPAPVTTVAAARAWRLWSRRAAAAGTTSPDTAIESPTAAAIARAMSPKSWPTSPSTKSTGRNTATLVSVLARIAPHTSWVPFTAASFGGSPALQWTKMFSSTTTELSISMPTANAMPARLITLSVRSKAARARKVPITLTGIDIATISVERTFRRNRSRVPSVSRPPTRMLSFTSPMAESM